jgi:hypothetical protein
MGWSACHSSASITPIQLSHRGWIVVGLLCWLFIPMLYASAGEDRQGPQRVGPPQDACQRLLRASITDLQKILDARLRRGFPVTAQLDEGNARLAPLAIHSIDCEQQLVVIAGSYEFRGNLGVMDITRRGTTVLQLRLSPKLEQRQVWLEAPEAIEVTFENPAPWFDGKAISNWALALFAHPLCASLDNGQPC